MKIDVTHTFDRVDLNHGQILLGIQALIHEQKPDVPLAELVPTAVLQGLGYDSLDAIELLLTLEERFSIEIPDSALENKEFRTIGDLATLIETLTSSATGAGA